MNNNALLLLMLMDAGVPLPPILGTITLVLSSEFGNTTNRLSSDATTVYVPSLSRRITYALSTNATMWRTRVDAVNEAGTVNSFGPNFNGYNGWYGNVAYGITGATDGSCVYILSNTASAYGIYRIPTSTNVINAFFALPSKPIRAHAIQGNRIAVKCADGMYVFDGISVGPLYPYVSLAFGLDDDIIGVDVANSKAFFTVNSNGDSTPAIWSFDTSNTDISATAAATGHSLPFRSHYPLEAGGIPYQYTRRSLLEKSGSSDKAFLVSKYASGWKRDPSVSIVSISAGAITGVTSVTLRTGLMNSAMSIGKVSGSDGGYHVLVLGNDNNSMAVKSINGGTVTTIASGSPPAKISGITSVYDARSFSRHVPGMEYSIRATDKRILNARKVDRGSSSIAFRLCDIA